MHKKTTFLAALIFSNIIAFAQASLEITEIWPGNEPGNNLSSDWFEITNHGNSAWVFGADPNLYYDDDSQDPTAADIINGITDIQPNESVIIVLGTAQDATDFNMLWAGDYNLTGIEIGYSDGSGLGGGGDGVTLWVGDPNAGGILSDFESYPDASANGGQSYDVELAAFSTVDNANQAGATSTLNDQNQPAIASPGNQGPLGNIPGAPDITVNTNNLTAYLSLSEQGPGAVSSVINDPTDPAKTLGIPFNISDDKTPLASLTVTATSSDETVVSNSNLVLTGSDGSRVLTITPSTLGFTTITVTVEDTDNNINTYIINYAASNASISPANSHFHTGASDGSTAIPVDGDYMWVGDDEDQTLRLYNRNRSGLPLSEINFNSDLGSSDEIDIEASIKLENTLYWIGSSATSNRSVLFSTTISGSGASSTLTYGAKYTSLRDDLFNGGFGLPGNFEIEAMAFAPNGSTVYLGFRVPDNGGDAIIVPVTNFTSLPGASAGSATFGEPIYLNLGGRTLRSMESNDNGCIIIAGPNGTTTDFALYTWSGEPTDNPELRTANLTALNTNGAFEGIVELPANAFMGSAGDAQQIQIISDLGATTIYDDGTENKDHRREWKKFRTDWVTLGAVVIPTTADPLINEFVVDHTGSDSEAFIEILGDQNTDYSTFTLLEIEGDSGSTTGIIDAALTLGTTNSNGFWISNEDAENGSITFLLVEDFSGNVGDDIDTNDDGVIDNAPWTRIVDDVATSDGGETDIVYSTTNLAPNYDGVSFQPGGASRIPNGIDTNTTADWVRNDYDGAGFAALNPGTPDVGEAINTPSAQNQIVTPPLPNLQITEIWPGNDPGSNLTADWFEITNTGDIAWTPASGDLYFDDESQDPASAAIISGITSIQPGEVVIAVDDATADEFLSVWAAAYNLTGIQIGTYDGAGLGQGGDGVTLWVGNPTTNGTLVDFETYPDANLNGGQSYDVDLAAFSTIGNTNNAGKTLVVNDASQPATASPGNQGPTLSIQNNAFNYLNMKIYPIPFENDITLSANLNASVKANINIINALGSIVYHNTQTLFNGQTVIQNLSALPSGIYILNIPELNLNRRIVKK